ncbi:MAG: hypothetical protein GPJ54_05825 [Candidatus Heimdallarchaeota archaeon]|nr:hypothetical protein [Candidatus Heimdallarchaeota archaeon]
MDEPDWDIEHFKHIPFARKSRLEAHFEKIQYVYCKVCGIDIERQGKYCILCTGSTYGNKVRTIFIEKRIYKK